MNFKFSWGSKSRSWKRH